MKNIKILLYKSAKKLFNLANPIAAKKFKDKIPKKISYFQIFSFMGKRYSNANLRFIFSRII